MAARGDFSGHDDEPAPEDDRSRMARILAQCGVRADDLDRATHRPAQPWHLLPENVRVWRLWCALQTQWVYAGIDGRPVGLSHTSVWASIDGMRMRGRRWVFETVSAMERATLDVWRAKEEQAK